MKRTWQLISAIILLLTLALSPLAIGCQPEETHDSLNLWDSGPMTLDPALSSEVSSHTYIMQIFSGLVCLNNELKPTPDIAKSWQKSKDGKTYTFLLRKGVKFHDGSSLDANDVVMSWVVAWDASNPLHVGNTGAFGYFTYLWGDLLNAE